MIYAAAFLLVLIILAGSLPFFAFVVEEKVDHENKASVFMILFLCAILLLMLLFVLSYMAGKGNPADKGISALSPGVYKTISCVNAESEKQQYVCFLKQEGPYFRTVRVNKKLPENFVKSTGKIVPLS